MSRHKCGLRLAHAAHGGLAALHGLSDADLCRLSRGDDAFARQDEGIQFAAQHAHGDGKGGRATTGGAGSAKAQSAGDKAAGNGERDHAVRRCGARIGVGERRIGGGCNQNNARNDSERP